jgi:negative regulator of sigma E activity
MSLPHRRRVTRAVLEAELAAKNHSILELPRETVAGREARVLDLRPRVAGRPSYRLWFDAALGIALGLESHDAEGNLITRWQFETFELGSPAAAADPDDGMQLQTLLAQKPYPLWVPAALPEGYEFHGARVHTRDDRTSVTLAYTDGMNVISVIQRNPTGEPWKPEMEVSAQGRPVVHRWNWYGTRILKVRLGDTFVTVVGHESPESLTDMIRTMVEHR